MSSYKYRKELFMKPLIAALLALFLLSLSIQAEDHVPGITGKGVKLGIGLADISTTLAPYEDMKSFSAATVGVFVTYGFRPNVSLQAELLIEERGAGEVLSLITTQFRDTYLEIPILVKYRLSSGGRVIPSVFLGPAFGFLISAKIDDPFVIKKTDIKDLMKGYDLSIVLGGAIDYHRFGFDIRYTIGMVNILDRGAWNHWIEARDAESIFDLSQYLMTDGGSMKNRFLSFAVSFRF
jgi:outer membrane protein with beta-barrel domain